MAPWCFPEGPLRGLFCVAVVTMSVVTIAFIIISHVRLTQLLPHVQHQKSFSVLTRIGAGEATDQCPSVIPHMLDGVWLPRQNVSGPEMQEMDEYLVNTRSEYKIPASLQRADGLCGNVPYEGMSLDGFMSLRAVCNPRGPTPCCREDRCDNSSALDCRCGTCYDSRVPLHAELSVWMPVRPECRPRQFTSSQACGLLQGTRLLVVGDSFLRHVFVALAILLSGDFYTGALKKNADPKVLARCTGMYQINGLACRALLDNNRTFCQESVWVEYHEVFKAFDSFPVFPVLNMSALRKERLLVLAGIGIHDNFFPLTIWNGFLYPLMNFWTERATFNRTQPSGWPKVIWANAHAPGLLKNPSFLFQSFKGVQMFNVIMNLYLQPYSIPILDFFKLTAPLHSVDGTHYGYGANMAKVQILLNWVLEQKERGQW